MSRITIVAAHISGLLKPTYNDHMNLQVDPMTSLTCLRETALPELNIIVRAGSSTVDNGWLF